MSTPEEVHSRNRLTIAHLLLWTLGSAIVLACFRAFTLSDQREDPLTPFWPIYAFFYSLLSGAQVGSLFLLGWRFFRRIGGFPTQPGHWLLIGGGVSVALGSMGDGVASRFEEQWRIWAFTQIPGCTATAILFAIALAVQRVSRAWKISYAMLIFQNATVALFYLALNLHILLAELTPAEWLLNFLQFQGYCGSPVVAGVAVLAAIGDPLRGQRDFLHWAGVTALLGTTLVQLTFSVVLSHVWG